MPSWEEIEADLCIVGAGSGGLSVAAGASRLGARVVLVERSHMGGDCLNYGCVPSKALIAAAHAAHAVRTAHRFGVHTPPPTVDMGQVHDHVHGVIAAIAPHDSVERFEGLGVRVIQAEGRFLDPLSVAAAGYRIRAKRFVVATGSRPAIPPIPGLEKTPFFTNETLFGNRQTLPHLVVMGGGPIGVELAQAYLRLGSRVTLVEMGRLLPRADSELAKLLAQRMREEGITLLEETRVTAADTLEQGIRLQIAPGGMLEGSHLLVATGRKPNLESLNLAEAEIEVTPAGIVVDNRLRTSNKRVFAIGDVAGPYPFTHMAGYQAGIVIRNALFRLPAKVDYRAVPWVIYGDPELAQVGLTEARAKETGVWKSTVRRSFLENDRARAEGRTDGMVKVVTGTGGKILGASLLGHGAGELLAPWCLAVARGLTMGAMASLILPYPTWGEINKAVAGEYFSPTLFSDKTRRLVKWLSWLP